MRPHLHDSLPNALKTAFLDGTLGGHSHTVRAAVEHGLRVRDTDLGFPKALMSPNGVYRAADRGMMRAVGEILTLTGGAARCLRRHSLIAQAGKVKEKGCVCPGPDSVVEGKVHRAQLARLLTRLGYDVMATFGSGQGY